jgi:hypothetical protein
MLTQPHLTHVTDLESTASQADFADARWADDGGNQAEPSAAATAREAAWQRVSTELADRFAEIADRDDVLVRALPHTRAGAPGMVDLKRAQMEIERGLFRADPEDLHPAQVGDEERYPTAWGVLTHEAGHAAHSRWCTRLPAQTDPADHEAATLLDESRIEHRQAARRPEDRRWLRSAAIALILGEFDPAEPGDRYAVAHAAGLLLARRDAGILETDETMDLERIAEKVLGHDTLAALARIWTQAHRTGDEDAESMLRLGRAWNEMVGTATGQDVSAEELAEAIGRTVRAVRANDTLLADLTAGILRASQARAAAKKNEAEAARRAQSAAKDVFGPGSGRRRPGWTPVIATRPPSAAERAAAGRLARALRAAAYRERIVTTQSSAAPPGRLRMRGALACDAQRAACATPTAQPWISTTRRHAPSPPLRLGIAVDVSGSMGAATAPIASAAWILAKAAASTDPDSKTATVAYDARLAAITQPGRALNHVSEFAALDGGHDLAGAIDALDGGLELTRPGTGRLLVIASDGYYFGDEAAEAAARITRLIHHGCAVLWLAFAPDPTPLPGAALVQLTDPARTTDEIGKAATHALISVATA